LTEVAREWLKARPVTENPATEKVVEKFIAAKESARRSDRHVRDLRERLDKFASAFRCCIADVTTSSVESWLQSLDVGPRSRRNYLGSVASLAKFAERRGWIPRGALDLSGVERSHSEGEVQIFTPDELRRLLAAMRSDLVPFVALGAFAGLRTAEIQRLDWSEVGPEFIDVKAAKAKTRSRRLVPILVALTKWLEPHRKADGPVCPLVDVWHGLAPYCELAGVAWKPNGLRHSFGSYRLAQTRNEGQVSLEMGNSPAMIFRHYRALVTPEQAEEWFGVHPSKPPES
jgi:integrase